MRALGFDPVADTQQTFRAMVDAMSRPGTIHTVPAGPADHAVVITLVDNEVTFHTADESLSSALAAANRLTAAPIDEADIIHLGNQRAVSLDDANQGTLKEPSDGATVIYRVEAIHETARSDDTNIKVCGPGVPDRRVIGVDGIPSDVLRTIADVNTAFPRGLDVVIAAEETVTAIPRSTTLEVL